MASVTAICNLALQMVKVSKQISDIEEGTKEANACEVVYAELRDLILELHNWNFGTKRVKLAQLSETPAFEWDYGYQLPNDFIRKVSVHSGSGGRDQVPHKVEGGQINSDASDLYLRYVARIEDPNIMPPSFRNALSKLIASRLAPTLSSDIRLAKVLWEEYIGEDLPTAKSTDSIQDFADQLPESSWVTARLGNTHDYEPGTV